MFFLEQLVTDNKPVHENTGTKMKSQLKKKKKKTSEKKKEEKKNACGEFPKLCDIID